MISTCVSHDCGSRMGHEPHAYYGKILVVPSTGTSKSINSRSEHAVAPVHKAGKRPAYSGHETYNQQLLLLLPSSSATWSCRSCDGFLLRAGWPGTGLLSRPATHSTHAHRSTHISHITPLCVLQVYSYHSYRSNPRT